MSETMDYRLALIIPQSMKLVALPTADGYALPRVSISQLKRPAEELTRLIEDRWALQTIVLDILSEEPYPIPCAVMEMRNAFPERGDCNFNIVSLDQIHEHSLRADERTSIRAILAGSDDGKGVFSHIGWVDEAKAWIQKAIQDRPVNFTSEMRHLNAGGEFCLLRLGTMSGPAYWLKAVGEPNLHEFGITAYLSEHYPKYLPRIVASREDWKAWVMEEVGTSLHSSNSLHDFESAARVLAELQVHLSGRSKDLLAVGCRDHRISVLEVHIDEIVDYLNEAMSLQTSTKAPRLSTHRLGDLKSLLHRTCSSLQELAIPDSIMHNDISPGSILSDGTNCVLTDWCEAYVGNPFITFEQLYVHSERKTGDPQSWLGPLRRAYKAPWSDVLDECQIETAFQLSPLISVLSYLYGRGEWLHSNQRNDPAFQSYSRSLARHMDRIARSQDRSEVPWKAN